MRRLSESIAVKASSSFTLACVKTSLLEHGPQGSASLALRFPLPDAFVRGLTVEKSVSLAIAYAQDGEGNDVAISWKPAGTRALPEFSGRLSTSAETQESCRLTLAGGYLPPGGVAGALFDSLIGVRIARATILALLNEFAAGIESDYAARLVP